MSAVAVRHEVNTGHLEKTITRRESVMASWDRADLVAKSLAEEIQRIEALIESGQKEIETSLRDDTNLSRIARMRKDYSEMTAYLRGLRFSAAPSIA